MQEPIQLQYILLDKHGRRVIHKATPSRESIVQELQEDGSMNGEDVTMELVTPYFAGFGTACCDDDVTIIKPQWGKFLDDVIHGLCGRVGHG